MKILLRLIDIHIKELIRDPGVFIWGIVFPILMLLGLGIAFSGKQEITRSVAIVGNIQQELYARINKTTSINIDGMEIECFDAKLDSLSIGKNHLVFYKTDDQLANTLLKRGYITLIVKNVISDGPEYSFDARNTDAQLTYLIVRSFLENNLQEITAKNVKALKVPGTRYVDFLLPGLIAMGIMMSCMWGLCYGLIEKRSKKLLRRLVATPMKKSHYLFSMSFVRIFFGLFESIILILFAKLVFDFKIEGSIMLLFFLFLLSHWAFSGISILMASRTTNTEIGQGIVNAVTTPMVILSGIFFSYQSFPSWAKTFIQCLPLTIVADAFRKVILEGADFGQIHLPLLGLFLIGFLSFALGLKIFKWY